MAHQIYKGCSSWIKKAGTRDSATNAEKRFKYEKEKRPEWIFNAKWCEGRPWLGHKEMCVFMVTCVKKSMVGQHYYFYLQNRK